MNWIRDIKIAIKVIVVAIVALLLLNQTPASSPERIASTDPVEPQQPQLLSASTRLLFTGEVFWGRSYERNRRNNVEGALQFPFSGLDTYDRDQYDSWIGFLECPITNENVPFDEEWNAIRLNCRPEFLPEFAKWYDIVSLAGNHANDVNGLDGYELTKDYLDQTGVDYFGRFDPNQVDDICKVISVPLRLTYDRALSLDSEATTRAESDISSRESERSVSEYSTRESERKMSEAAVSTSRSAALLTGKTGAVVTSELPMAFCGYNGVFQTISQESIDVIGRYSERYFTVVMPQTGAEYVPGADSIKTRTYRAMIDAGADLVVGSHPHWVQNSEVYKDKLILYSVGNFIFDQNFSTEVRSSASLDATLDFTTPEQLTYIQSLIDRGNVGRADPDLKYDLIPGLMTNLVQRRADDSATINRILQRTNWTATQAQLDL